jgi:group II intron reverse transcriptase/maturase
MNSYNASKPPDGANVRRVGKPPEPVKRVDIPKPSGGVRPWGIPTVTDRLIQQAIAQVLVPIFDPDFLEHSYGFRPGRCAHDAVRKVRDHIKEGYRWAVDMDLEKFFDTFNHDVLMHRVARKVRDKQLLKLIGKYLRAGAVVNGSLVKTRKGVPQGGPMTPLPANIVLDDLDKELERRGHHFVRYADDCAPRKRRKEAEIANSLLPSCTEDEGGPLGIGLQDQVPNRPGAAWVKSSGSERPGKRCDGIASGESQKDERK